MATSVEKEHGADFFPGMSDSCCSSKSRLLGANSNWHEELAASDFLCGSL